MTGTRDNMLNMDVVTLTHEQTYKTELERKDKGALSSWKLNFGAEFSHR